MKGAKLDYSPALDKNELVIAKAQKQVRIEKAERHVAFLKRKEVWQDLLGKYSLLLTGFLTSKLKEKELKDLIAQFVNKIPGESCKIILKAYGVPFKVKDMYKQVYAEKVSEVLGKIVKTPAQLCKVILFLNALPSASVNRPEDLKYSMGRLK